MRVGAQSSYATAERFAKARFTWPASIGWKCAKSAADALYGGARSAFSSSTHPVLPPTEYHGAGVKGACGALGAIVSQKGEGSTPSVAGRLPSARNHSKDLFAMTDVV
eukprot:scaffold125063_cov35-Tisochrysis_lutea.AAC.1